MFNDLTGSNQYVGNWPGVTVEKKEGRLKGDKEVVIRDLPGIYSLSPYTLEEVVARGYLVNEEAGRHPQHRRCHEHRAQPLPDHAAGRAGDSMVVALNMIDVTRKNGDVIDAKKLGAALGCTVVETSALKGQGSLEARARPPSWARRSRPSSRRMCLPAASSTRLRTSRI